jgi:pimeloyl-ACP methyl ester carboxylesterase
LKKKMPVENDATPGAESRTLKCRTWRKIKYFLSGLVALVLSLAIIGAIYQYVASSRDLRTYSPPGVFVQVNGYKMHIYCAGGINGAGPTVILESGLNDGWLSWYKVQPAIARFASVCSYDRAGVGWSDAQPDQPDSQNIALRLHSLLHNAGIKPPYILVGHSIAGIHVRVYQKMYPNDVAGIVLVDPSHPDEMNRLPSQFRKGRGQRRLKFELLELAMPFGIPRFTGRCGEGPAEIRNLLRTAQCRTRWMETQEAEFDAFDKSADEGRATGSFGAMPLVVLSHDPKIGGRPGALAANVAEQAEVAWGQMQEELSHLSTSGNRIVAEGSAHYIQFDRPDLVIDAVHQAVEASRNGVVTNSTAKTSLEHVGTRRMRSMPGSLP